MPELEESSISTGYLNEETNARLKTDLSLCERGISVILKPYLRIRKFKL